MIRTTQPDHVRGCDAVFKYLRLPGCQSQLRCGISLGSLTHLGRQKWFGERSIKVGLFVRKLQGSWSFRSAIHADMFWLLPQRKRTCFTISMFALSTYCWPGLFTILLAKKEKVL
jgi:hypothetical protein